MTRKQISIEVEADVALARLKKTEMLLNLLEAKFQVKVEPNEYQDITKEDTV